MTNASTLTQELHEYLKDHPTTVEVTDWLKEREKEYKGYSGALLRMVEAKHLIVQRTEGDEERRGRLQALLALVGVIFVNGTGGKIDSPKMIADMEWLEEKIDETSHELNEKFPGAEEALRKEFEGNKNDE